MTSLTTSDKPCASKAPSNFQAAFFILPSWRREALVEFYGFCRYADDLVDEVAADDPKAARLALDTLERDIELAYSGIPETPMGQSVARLVARFPIRKEDFLAVVAGCRMDLDERRYSTEEEVDDYCDHVASAVGLACLAIFGVDVKTGERFAVALGRAFQWTNILRDIREDLKRERCYLPAAWFERFHVARSDLTAGTTNTHVAEMLRFGGAKALNYYREAEAEMRKLPVRPLGAAILMRTVYFDILAQIMNDPVRVLSERIRLSTGRKMYCVGLGALEILTR